MDTDVKAGQWQDLTLRTVYLPLKAQTLFDAEPETEEMPPEVMNRKFTNINITPLRKKSPIP